MSIAYTNENKFALLDTTATNWGAAFNGVIEALETGAELSITAGEDLQAYDAVSLNILDEKVYKAKSGSSTLTPAIGFVVSDTDEGNTAKIRWWGYMDINTSFSVGDSVSWSPGECVWLGSVAGRLAKSQYSWANVMGFAKDHTDASWNTRIIIKPQDRCSKLVKRMAVEDAVVFVSEYDNGNSGSGKTVNWVNGNKQKLVLTDNCVLEFGHPFGVCTVTLKVQQDGVGSRTVTWPSNVKWSGGTAPTLTTTADGIDIVAFYYDGGTYYGSAVLDFQ